jgi:uncharacterized protein (TIGR03083 family)
MWHDPTMNPRPGTGDLYLAAQRSFVDFARTLCTGDWSAAVPCTPGWTVRDVLSHVSGVADDALAGRLDGVPGDAWTAAQVERNRELDVDRLFDRWATQASDFADVLQTSGDARPAIDCHSHEHDIRHALGRAGARDSIVVDTFGLALARVDAAPFGLVVEFDDGRVVTSGTPDGAGAVTLRTNRFEVFRSRLGRRSPPQVRAYDWVGTEAGVDAVVAGWFHFGPSKTAIDE